MTDINDARITILRRFEASANALVKALGANPAYPATAAGLALMLAPAVADVIISLRQGVCAHDTGQALGEDIGACDGVKGALLYLPSSFEAETMRETLATMVDIVRTDSLVYIEALAENLHRQARQWEEMVATLQVREVA